MDDSVTLNRFQLAILLGLSKLQKHVYPGTVPRAEVERRRAASRRARAARRISRV